MMLPRLGDEPDIMGGTRDGCDTERFPDDAPGWTNFHFSSPPKAGGPGPAAARPAGRGAQVPRVAGYCAQPVFVGRGLAEFSGIGLSDENRARGPQSPDHPAVFECDVGAVNTRSARRHEAGDIERVLDRNRDARQWPSLARSPGLLGPPCLGKSQFVQHDNHGAELAIAIMDALERGLGNVDGRDFALPESIEQTMRRGGGMHECFLTIKHADGPRRSRHKFHP